GQRCAQRLSVVDGLTRSAGAWQEEKGDRKCRTSYQSNKNTFKPKHKETRLRIRTGFGSLNPRGAEVMLHICSRRATARDLGFSIRTDLVTGMAETLSWTQGNRPRLIPETENATPPLARQENIS
ncbi:MAG: hypothetical protein ACOH2M_31070, partial [Cypionkella sp.]